MIIRLERSSYYDDMKVHYFKYILYFKSTSLFDTLFYVRKY